MANIIRKSSAQTSPIEWSPFRAMRDLFRWDPYREMTPFPREEWLREFSPDFEVKETKDGLLFRADVPGILEKDLEISLSGNVLTISGKREEEKKEEGERQYTYERSYGSFTRSFALPDSADVEHGKAELKEGVLTVAFPLRAGARAMKIPVKTAGSKS
jgi:HSP20 family protein